MMTEKTEEKCMGKRDHWERYKWEKNGEDNGSIGKICQWWLEKREERCKGERENQESYRWEEKPNGEEKLSQSWWGRRKQRCKEEKKNKKAMDESKSNRKEKIKQVMMREKGRIA